MNELENWLDNNNNKDQVGDQTPTTDCIQDNKNRICKHVCEKKRRRCKFNAIRNSDYCVEHLAFNEQDNHSDERIICPLDPKHSVYAKNFEKHLKKCNSRVKNLGDFDVKNVNFADDEERKNDDDDSVTSALMSELQLSSESTYKELNEVQLRNVLDYLVRLDQELGLANLSIDKLENEFIVDELAKRNDYHQKHMKQIASIVGHVEHLVSDASSNQSSSSRCCLVELGAGRGRLSYWYEQSRHHHQNQPGDNEEGSDTKNLNKQTPNILLIERGSQRLKFDSMLKKNLDEEGGEFARIRIDLKDLSINRVELIRNSSSFVLYGKHLCGVGTDFALRCLRNSLVDTEQRPPKFRGIVLAVCCHHQCEWESLCGREFLRSRGIGSALFYIIRSISSWSTCGDRNITAPQEYIFGHQRQKVGRICKGLIDYARIQYLKSIKLPTGCSLNVNRFYYVEPEVTLENAIIKASLELTS